MLIRDISEKDLMLDPGKEAEYFKVGSDALDICKRILGGRTPKRILDFPSGYGRVLRYFRMEWPNSEIFGIETDRDALDFVQAKFGATPVIADPELKMEVPNNADLIFSGSLLTHFDDWQWDLFLNLCIEALSPDGTFIFTTHGRIAALLAKDKHPVYGNMIDMEQLYKKYQKDGFAFEPYSKDYPTFGLSLSSPEWIMQRLQKMPSVKIVYFEEGGWGQDVIALRRNPWPLIQP